MKNKTLRREYLSTFFRGNKLAYCAMLLTSILFSVLNLAVAWLNQQLVDNVSGEPDALSLSVLTVLTVGIILLIIPIKGLQYWAQPQFMKKALSQFKSFAFRELTRKNIASFQSEATGTYISAFSNDLTSIETNYLEKQYALVFNLVWAAGAVVLMLLYSPILAAIAIGLCALPFLASMREGARMEKAEKAVSEKNGEFTASLKDILSGFSVIKSFRAEDAAVSLLEQSSREVETAKCRKRRISVLLGMIGGVASLSAQMGTFLAGAVLTYLGWGITPGILFVFMDLTGAVITVVGEMPELLASRRAALGLVDKMARTLELNVRDEGKDIPNCLENGISVHNLCFCYEQDNEILHDINIDFKAGKSYAIVGNSGSGKSTLLKLLMASHHDYKGAICYDNTELMGISSKSLYEMVSMVEQNVFVFDASIRDNITMFRDFPAADVDRAIELSGLSRLINERGRDYLCGENGKNLSGGEKQRIAIARSLLQKSSVLLADEVTAALDAQTAYQVTGDILKLDGITRIVVTHSLVESLLKQYDGIMVLKDGHIVESGMFDDLMDKKGYFYALYTVAQ